MKLKQLKKKLIEKISFTKLTKIPAVSNNLKQNLLVTVFLVVALDEDNKNKVIY